MFDLDELDLDRLAEALADELDACDDPDLALQRAIQLSQGEPSGFSGPAARSDEVEFTEDGRPILLFHKAINYPRPAKDPEFKGVGGPYDTAHQPSIPPSPEVERFTSLRRKPYEKQPTEGHSMSFIKKINRLVLAKNLFFADVVSTVKGIYPEIKMIFPQPPTYVWNPKDEKAKLDIQKIKNNLKVRFPDLEWTARGMDGVLLAQMDFPDGSAMDFLIGDNANHLTLTYYAPKKGVVTDEGLVETEDEQ